MMSHNTRPQKVADQIQKELAILIQREVKDPRLGFVTVSSVKVSRDLSYADVYITELGKDSAKEAAKTIEVLSNASGFLRSSLARIVKLRSTPQLRFHFDDTLARGRAMSDLIDKASAEKDSKE